MRAERSPSATGVPPKRPEQTFTEALARARPRLAIPAVRPAVHRALSAAAASASRVADHLATAQGLKRARAGHAMEANRLAGAREERPGPDAARQRLAKELERELLLAVQAQPPAPGRPATPEAERAAPASKVESALKLVERIEVFLRSGKPQLELWVGGQLGAVVLLERTGPKEVAVTIRGRRGPPPPAELARVREEMRRRGLKLSSLTIG